MQVYMFFPMQSFLINSITNSEDPVWTESVTFLQKNVVFENS